MDFMPGDNRARDAYDDWCAVMGGFDADGRVLRRWSQLSGQERIAWEDTVGKTWADATRAVTLMNSPTAGVYGDPASAAPVEYGAGVYGAGASGYGVSGAGVSGVPASAVPSMNP